MCCLMHFNHNLHRNVHIIIMKCFYLPFPDLSKEAEKELMHQFPPQVEKHP